MASGIPKPRHPISAISLAQTLLLAAGLIGGNVHSTKAEDAYVCKLFAREYLRTIYVHNLKTPNAQSLDLQQKAVPETTDTTKLPFLYKKLIANCLGSDKVPDLPEVPEATDKAWLEDLVSNHLSKASGPPAASEPQGEVTGEPPAKSVPVLTSEQDKAQATCGKVNMRVAWTNNGRSWRCVK